MQQNATAAGAPHWGSLTALSRPPSWFTGAASRRGGEGQGREQKGRGGKGNGKGREGQGERGRRGEVDSDAQLEQGR